MKIRLLAFFILIIGYAIPASAQRTQKILEKNTVDHLFTCSLDLMMDTLAMTYHLPIVFERDSLRKYDIVDHFFNEKLKDVFEKVCAKNQLHYWIDRDGKIYILENVDDFARLKKRADSLENIRVKATPAPPPVITKAPERRAVIRHNITISGRVVDEASGEALTSATIQILNTSLSVTARQDGGFTLFDVPADTSTVLVNYTGYESERFKLNSKKADSVLVIAMYKSINTLNEVSILGKKSGVMNTDTKKVGVLQLTPANLDKLPNIGEKDILRAFQLMPGVSATNESSSGAYVRGGTPDQNLVLFDGFTVYEVDHLYGFFSAFNANAVKDVELYKGGFSAQFGGRLSSVTDITGKDGNSKQASYGIDLSLLSINAFMETPVTDKSSLVLAFRRSYQGPFYDKLFGQFNASAAISNKGGGFGGPGGGGFGEQTTPASHFYDADIRYTYHINRKNELVWSFYSGEDKTDNSRSFTLPAFLSSSSTGSNAITDYTKYGNVGSSLRWFSQLNDKVHGNTYLTYSSYFNNRDRGTSGTTTDSEGNTTSFDNGTLEKNNLQDIGLKTEWVWQKSNKVQFLYGGFVDYLHVNYDYIQNDTSHLINEHNSAINTGIYGEIEYDPTSKLHLQPGMRATFYSPTSTLYLEPRFSASYLLTDNYTLKFATGQFYQYMNQVTRDDIADGNRNFWVLSNNQGIPVGRSRHIMGGVSFENKLFLIDVEGYYKSLSGLTQYTISQTGGFGPRGGGGETLTEDFYSGTGRAYGVEVLIQKKLGNYTGWIGYTLADAQNKFAVFGNSYYPADQDIRHEFKSINMYHENRWNFSAVFIFATGHPYTAPISTYSFTTAEGNRQTYFNVSGKNAERLPDYHRLDLSATYDLLKINGDKIGSIGLSLFNVYNHVNVWYKEYYLVNNAAVTTNVNYLGFTPNLTLSLRWK